MGNVTDRRVQKTKMALHDALITLMHEKRYDDILVQEILDRADVGRSTFYTHFQDKDDLLVEGIKHLRLELSEAQNAARYSSENSYDRVIGFSYAMFDHAYSHRQVYRSLIGGQGWIVLQPYMEEVLTDIMTESAKPLYKGSSSDTPFELFIHFLSSTFWSVMTWWLNERNPMPPQDINLYFRELVIPSLMSKLK